MPDTSSDISITTHNGVQVIRFTRVDKKNALTGAMYDAAREALIAAEHNDDIAVHLFLGAPGAFSAGNDMNDFVRRATAATADITFTTNAPSRAPGQTVIGPAGDFIRVLPKITKPMIAAVDGLAVGIGVTLLMHCDLVLASPAATFRTPFVNLGLIQEAGTSVIGPHRLGYQNAFELLVLGALWDAARAKEAGLINWLVPSAELEPRAFAIAHDLVHKPREALMAARRMLRGDPSAISAAIEAETDIYRHLMGSPEAREAFSSFLEKRKPDFAKARAAAKAKG
jgi:enoyl-CoA hydratase/carnithine racemase